MRPDTQYTVTLYVRADAPIAERRSAVIERLRQFERQGRIAGFEIQPWPRAVSLDLFDTIGQRGLRNDLQRFESWASEHGLRIRPHFQVRTASPLNTTETDTMLVLPTICVAVHDDEELLGVTPCSDGDSVCSVDDLLDALADDDPVVDVFSTGETRVSADTDERDALVATDS